MRLQLHVRPLPVPSISRDRCLAPPAPALRARIIGGVRLFHLSVLHFGAEDPAALAWARQAIAVERPDAVAITGDLTMRARRREFDAACAWIGGLGGQVTVEVGNHDLPYFNLPERLFAPYRRFR